MVLHRSRFTLTTIAHFCYTGGMGTIAEDLTGRRYGRWLVLYRSDRRTKNHKQQPYWWCECQCPDKTLREVFAPDLKRGGSLSCGCWHHEYISSLNTKHGLSQHPAYESWTGAKSRCRNPNCTSYY